jgi:HAD superfamily hydrolase (TIGR01509 family)
MAHLQKLGEFCSRSGTPGLVALRALIFDFDGTLAETERDGHRVAYNDAFADLGLAWHWDPELYGKLLAVAGGKERVIAYIEQYDPPRPPGDPAELAARIHKRKIERFAALAANIPLRPGVARLVASAKDAGLTLAIATTASESGVRAVVGRSPATLDAFALIAAGDVVARKKPAPDIYEYALAELGIPAREAIAFEDSSIGLRAARGAAIATVVTPSLYTQGETFAEAAAVVSSLGEPTEPAHAVMGPELPEGFVSLAWLATLANRA